jgi:hypothetical protein
LQTIPADALVETKAAALTPVSAANVIALINFIVKSFIVYGSKQALFVGNETRCDPADASSRTLYER